MKKFLYVFFAIMTSFSMMSCNKDALPTYELEELPNNRYQLYVTNPNKESSITVKYFWTEEKSGPGYEEGLVYEEFETVTKVIKKKTTDPVGQPFYSSPNGEYPYVRILSTVPT